MDLQINGDLRQVPAEITIARLLQALDLPLNGIAVAVNRTVVPSSAHERTTLADGDAVEIIEAVGGG